MIEQAAVVYETAMMTEVMAYDWVKIAACVHMVDWHFVESLENTVAVYVFHSSMMVEEGIGSPLKEYDYSRHTLDHTDQALNEVPVDQRYPWGEVVETAGSYPWPAVVGDQWIHVGSPFPQSSFSVTSYCIRYTASQGIADHCSSFVKDGSELE
jgi:hypothetical protein